MAYRFKQSKSVRKQIARRPQDATILTQPPVGQGVEI